MGLKVERKRESVPLLTSDDRDRLAELAAAMESAATVAARLNEDPVLEAARTFDEFKAEATERAPKVNITALPGREWRELLLAHPPRKDATNPASGEVEESWPQDKRVGFNVDTMSRPLALACIDLDQFDSEAEREEFVDDLADPDFSQIVSAAVRVNTDGGYDPKFSASSMIEQTYAVMSRSQAEEDSAPSSDSPTRIGDSSESTGV